MDNERLNDFREEEQQLQPQPFVETINDQDSQIYPVHSSNIEYNFTKYKTLLQNN